MRTVDYSEILAGTAALAGMSLDDVGVGEFALLRSFHDGRLQSGWEVHRWPELVRIEKRFFRENWSAATTYIAGAERYDIATGNYFQSLRDANVGQAPTLNGVENSTWWALCRTEYQADDWQATRDYAVGDQVRYAANGEFYQCHTAHTSAGSFDSSFFGQLTPFDRYIGWDQSVSVDVPTGGGGTGTTGSGGVIGGEGGDVIMGEGGDVIGGEG